MLEALCKRYIFISTIILLLIFICIGIFLFSWGDTYYINKDTVKCTIKRVECPSCHHYFNYYIYSFEYTLDGVKGYVRESDIVLDKFCTAATRTQNRFYDKCVWDDDRNRFDKFKERGWFFVPKLPNVINVFISIMMFGMWIGFICWVDPEDNLRYLRYSCYNGKRCHKNCEYCAYCQYSKFQHPIFKQIKVKTLRFLGH